jgi:hypothetical protein
MMLKYVNAYERLKILVNPDSILGKTLNRVMLIYSSRLNHCTVLGFK